MKVTTLSGDVPKNRADVVFYAKKNAASIGKANKDGSVSVYVQELGTDVVLGTGGLRHSLDRRFDVNAPVTIKAGEILQNSIAVNEMTPENPNADSSYILIGAAKNKNGELYVVRSVINRFKSELVSMDVLYAVNAKKESAGRMVTPQGIADETAILSDSTISISQLLDFVNKHFPDVLPESVLRHYGHIKRPEGELGESVLYSLNSKRDIVDIPSNKYADLYHHFGSTKNYDVAGYMLGNGVMLDFSGKHWGDTTSTIRQVDHRDVQEVLDDRGNNGTNAMIDMIGNGNIRLMPEVGGINLAVKPNETQMTQLRGYINHFRGEVVVDIDEMGGDTIHSFEYTRGTSSSKILSDIIEYFDNGVVPEKKAKEETDIRQFLNPYSLTPEGEHPIRSDGFNVTGEDVRLQELEYGAPIREDLATEEAAEVLEEAEPVINATNSRVLRRLTANLDNQRGEIESLQQSSEEAERSFDEKIAKAQAELDSKKDKDTKVANALRARIARLERRKADTIEKRKALPGLKPNRKTGKAFVSRCVPENGFPCCVFGCIATAR